MYPWHKTKDVQPQSRHYNGIKTVEKGSVEDMSGEVKEAIESARTKVWLVDDTPYDYVTIRLPAQEGGLNL